MALTRPQEIPTIDVVMVTIETGAGENQKQYAIDTATKVGVEVQVETTDAVKLVIKNVLKAQKPEGNTITGNKITLTDNVFTPEVVQILQGGVIKYDTTDPQKVIGYTPPLAGSSEKGVPFTLSCYSAQYNAAGIIVNYEKIMYPNCQGTPIALNSEDGTFRAPEYIINSAPAQGEAPYDIDYLDELPEVG